MYHGRMYMGAFEQLVPLRTKAFVHIYMGAFEQLVPLRTKVFVHVLWSYLHGCLRAVNPCKKYNCAVKRKYRDVDTTEI